MSVNEESRKTINAIDGSKFKDVLYASLVLLKEQQSLIDSLNVFPVPDGDTGTNMYLTFVEAVKEVKQTESNSLEKITAALAKGALMGARGNSGVILSQLLRGFSLANKGYQVLKPENLAKSFRRASEVAYQGVLKPVEGTILTVSRKAADGAELAFKNNLDLVGILQNTIEAAREALNKTPEQLPALKEAEVVDAGGQGYLTILEGMLQGLLGEKQYTKTDFEVVKPARKQKAAQEEIKYTYCTQVLITDQKNAEDSIDKIRNDLQNYGDSLMVVGAERVTKIHIHTNHPGVILEYALKVGSLNDIKIDNMKLQSEQALVEKEEQQKKEYGAERKIEKSKGIIAVGQGEGIKNILSELGVDKIIDGGQSMNPSTNDFVEAIKSIETDELIILPNNKNIISAANQAASLTDKKVEVIGTRTIPQAVSCLMIFNDQVELTDLKDAMEMEIQNVRTIEITTAVKDSKVNGINISKDDVIGLFDGTIESAGKSYQDVVVDLFTKKIDDEELVTIYYGEDVREEDAEQLKNRLLEEFELDEVEVYQGGQPLYPYIISLE